MFNAQHICQTCQGHDPRYPSAAAAIPNCRCIFLQSASLCEELSENSAATSGQPKFIFCNNCGQARYSGMPCPCVHFPQEQTAILRHRLRMQEVGTNTLFNLPADVQNHIASFLSPKDFTRLSIMNNNLYYNQAKQLPSYLQAQPEPELTRILRQRQTESAVVLRRQIRMEEADTSTLFNLPENAHNHFFSFLSPSDITLFSQVNKRFYAGQTNYIPPYLTSYSAPLFISVLAPLQKLALTRAYNLKSKLLDNHFTATLSLAGALIAARADHSVVLDAKGTLWVAGSNQKNQLGFKEHSNKNLFTPLLDKGPFLSVATGQWHSMALDTKGTLWITGSNYFGQLGLDDIEGTHIFTAVSERGPFVAIAAGVRHSLALDTQGQLWVAGNNEDGQLGLNDMESADPFEAVPERGPFIGITAGSFHSMALDTRGMLWVAGLNDHGQLGLDDRDNKSIFTPVPGRGPFIAIAAGRSHSMALDLRGMLWVAGLNNHGQLGLGDRENRSVFSPVPDRGPFVAIAAGSSHSMALHANGTIWITFPGNNSNVFIPIPQCGPFVAIATGDSHSLALHADGTLWVAGDNEKGQLGLGHNENRITCEPIPRWNFFHPN